MFNVKRAVEKLDELNEKSNIDYHFYNDLREVLLAGQDDSVEEKKGNDMSAQKQSLYKSVQTAHNRLCIVEGKLRTTEERLARLEAWMDANEVCLETTPDGTEKPVTSDDLLDEPTDLMDCTDEADPQSDNADEKIKRGVQLGGVVDEKPSEFTIEERKAIQKMREAKYDKPSEYIQIPRSVAEEWINKNTHMEGWDYFTGCKLVAAIKQSLNKD